MIKFNDTKYDNNKYKVEYGKYSIKRKDKRINGTSPTIFFELAGTTSCIIGVETVYDKKYLEELKISDKKDIKEYISDITYEDKDGWVSLICGNFESTIEKKKEKEFELNFKCNAKENNETFNIEIIETVLIN